MADEKLRRELIAYGYTPGPITDSTRRVLEKKLKKLHAMPKKLQNSRDNVRRSHHHDDSDNEESWKTHTSDRRSQPAKGRASSSTMRVETGPSQEESSWWGDESRYAGRSISSSARTDERTLWKRKRVCLPGHNPQRSSLDRYGYSVDEHVGDISRGLSTSRSLSSSRTAVDSLFYKTRLKQEKVSHFKSSWSKKVEHYLSRLLHALCVILLLVFTGILIIKSGILNTSKNNDMKLLSSDCESRKDTFCKVKQKEINLQILSELYDFLSLEAGSFECGNPSGLSSKCVPINRAKEHVMNVSGYAAEKFDAALEWMLSSDRHLGIWAKGEDTEELITARADIFCVESSRPRLGFVCRLKNAFYTAISNLFLALFGIFLLWIILIFLRYHWQSLEEEEKQMFAMVEKIIDIVEHHYKDWTFGIEQNPYVGILHVRDSLIMPQHRKRVKKVWDRAVRFVEDNESRVRTEMQRVAGADLRVWRWTQTQC